MANPEHVKILKKGVEYWNKWREENPKIIPDLSVAVLGGEDLRRADLRRADLRVANLKGADLSAAILNKANLWEANLSEVDFWRADLGHADLRRADLIEANLCKANLIRAKLSGAKLSGAKLHEALLHRVDLREADLFRADLRGSGIAGADISRADLRETNFSEVNLRETDLRETDLSSAYFSNCALNNVNFLNAVLRDTTFINVDLSNVHGLSETNHLGRSYIDIATFYKSHGNIPVDFLRKAGIPEDFINNYLPSIRKNPIEFYSCFISCSEKDIFFARRLRDTLIKRGIRCWLYDEDLKISDKLDKNIIEAIRREDKFILCMSKYSLKSSWVEKEIRTAIAKEEKLSKQEEDVLVLIPIDIDDYLFNNNCTNIFKEELENRLAAKFEGWERDNSIFEREVEKVIEALRIERGVFDKPPEQKL